jgi:hypothetical protein
MITYEQALEAAKKAKPNIDECTEWENGWMFGYSGDEGFDGGMENGIGRSPVIIRKSDGKRMAMIEFISSGEGAGEVVREFKI